MYKDKFVLSIIHDGRPVKETGGSYNRQVAIPFGSEYKIRLKNKNDRSCTARVTIDGVLASNMGDVIVNAGGTIDLERFITTSLKNGKRFKFVSVDHPNVDDPTKSENGIIRVEFRLAKKYDDLRIRPGFDIPYSYCPPFKEDNWGMKDSGWRYFSDPNNSTCGDFGNVTYTASKSKSSGDTVMSCCSYFNDAGATIEGSKSNQSFQYSNLDVEFRPSTILELKLVGLKTRPVNRNMKYCSQCGRRVKQRDKYCSACGNRL